MIYFTTAFLAEAKPLIKSLKLSLDHSSPFQIYRNENTLLIITGIGRDNALMATTHLLSSFPPSETDLLVNFGLAGAKPVFELGSLILAHTLHDSTTHKSFYPDMRLVHQLKELALTTVDAPQTTQDTEIETVDMEAFAVYKAALLFFKSHQILTFKVISDHFSAAIPSKEQTEAWIAPQIQTLLELVHNHQKRLPKKLNYSPALACEIQKSIDTLKLTVTQANQLHDRVKGYILRHHKEPLLPKHLAQFTQHKKEQKDAFSKLINLLTA